MQFQCFCPDLIGPTQWATIDGEVDGFDVANETVEFTITSVSSAPGSTGELPVAGDSITVSSQYGVSSGRALLFLSESGSGEYVVQNVSPVTATGEVICEDSEAVARDAAAVASASVQGYDDCIAMLDLDVECKDSINTLCSAAGSSNKPWGISLLIALGLMGLRFRGQSARR